MTHPIGDDVARTQQADKHALQIISTTAALDCTKCWRGMLERKIEPAE